jgi:hypothetical protein
MLLFCYVYCRARSSRGITANEVAVAAAAAAVEPQKKGGKKGGKKNNVNDLTGDDDEAQTGGKNDGKYARHYLIETKEKAKLAAIEKRSEELQKQVEILVTQNKENEKKRKKEEAENSATTKALKKALESAERDKEMALEKAARMEKEKETKREQAVGIAVSAAKGTPTSSAPNVDQQIVLREQQQIRYANVPMQPSHQHPINVAHTASADGVLTLVPQPYLQPYTGNLPADVLMSFWDQQDLRTEMRGRMQLMHQLYRYR